MGQLPAVAHRYLGVSGEGPEYETTVLMGPVCDIYDLAAMKPLKSEGIMGMEKKEFRFPFLLDIDDSGNVYKPEGSGAAFAAGTFNQESFEELVWWMKVTAWLEVNTDAATSRTQKVEQLLAVEEVTGQMLAAMRKSEFRLAKLVELLNEPVEDQP